jgi:hypothetical protein
MPGRATAVSSGRSLEDRVMALANALGMEARSQVRVGKRLWGAVRVIDVVVTDPVTRRRLGVECKQQDTRGTAEEKLPATIQDMASWPIDGLMVIDGLGFSQNIRSFLYSTGKAVDFADLEDWLRLYFGLELKA